MQQRFTKRAGFIDDWMDYLSHNAYDEAARLVPALGGRDKVIDMAEAHVSSDPQWAARLATYLILTNENDEKARQVRQQASIRFAQVTSSTNQRNYLLGLVAEENGDIDFDRMLRAPVAGHSGRWMMANYSEDSVIGSLRKMRTISTSPLGWTLPTAKFTTSELSITYFASAGRTKNAPLRVTGVPTEQRLSECSLTK